MDLRDRAVELRRAGKSLSNIKDELGASDRRLREWLYGVPPADWTKRPNAKDDLRARARELRIAGRSYREIVKELGVSKSSVSLWVRDLPQPMPDRAAHAAMMRERRWEPYRRQRDQEIAKVKADAISEIGQLSDREVLLIGAALYWAEGSKRKPWSQARVPLKFINSDPNVIRVFERWLDLAVVPAADRKYRVSIHESADVLAAHQFWAKVLG